MSEKICPNCGQSEKPARIDFHYIKHEIEHVLHFEKGILFTIKQLVLKPGVSIREFISDDRNRLVKPIVFIIITSLIYTLIAHFFHVEDGYVHYQSSTKTTTTFIFDWIEGHYGYANIIMGVFIAFWLKVFFKSYNYNFFEILILLCFVIGIEMLVLAFFAFFEGIIKIQLKQISGVIALLYAIYAITHFFDNHKKANYIKAFFAYVLGLVTFSFSAIILGILIDLTLKH